MTLKIDNVNSQLEVGTPTINAHVTTKQYVDTAISASKLITENAQAGSYIFSLPDGGNLVSLTGAIPATFTVPTNAAVAFPIGTTIVVTQDGTGQLTVAPDVGVTIKSDGTLTLDSQYATASLIKVDTDTWRFAEGNPTQITALTITTALGYTPVDVAGDTMLGDLILNADPTVVLGAATKQYADTKVAKAGDTMTGALVLNADPTLALHAATKQYVDTGKAPDYEFFTATASQTVFTLTTFTYTPGSKRLMVFVNGIKQVLPANGNYVETNTTTITFSPGLNLNDQVEFYHLY